MCAGCQPYLTTPKPRPIPPVPQVRPRPEGTEAVCGGCGDTRGASDLCCGGTAALPGSQARAWRAGASATPAFVIIIPTYSRIIAPGP